jgi:predicted dehydrogenase
MAINVAICGTGYIARIHARAIQNSREARLVAVAGHLPDKTAAFAAEFKIPNAFQNIRTLIHSGLADALVIGMPNVLHAPQTLAALNAGIAVMVEKPMAMNSAQAQKMLDASLKSGAPLMVAHNWRFDRDVLWLKKQADTGRLGRIIRTKGYGVHTNWGPAGWFTRKQLAGGGALVDMGVHAVDTVRFLLGDPQPSSVYASIGRNYIDGDVDDTGVMLVTWENGISSYIESGWWQPHCDGSEAATQLYGTRGFGMLFPTHLELPNIKEQKVKIVESGLPFPRKDHYPQEMYDRQMAAFVKSIKDWSTPKPGGKEGLINMKVLDAAYRSAKSGRSVAIK